MFRFTVEFFGNDPGKLRYGLLFTSLQQFAKSHGDGLCYRRVLVVGRHEIATVDETVGGWNGFVPHPGIVPPQGVGILQGIGILQGVGAMQGKLDDFRLIVAQMKMGQGVFRHFLCPLFCNLVHHGLHGEKVLIPCSIGRDPYVAVLEGKDVSEHVFDLSLGHAGISRRAYRIVGGRRVIAGLHVVLRCLPAMGHAITGQSADTGADGGPRQGCAGLVADDGSGDGTQQGTAARVGGGAIAGMGIVGAAC